MTPTCAICCQPANRRVTGRNEAAPAVAIEVFACEKCLSMAKAAVRFFCEYGRVHVQKRRSLRQCSVCQRMDHRFWKGRCNRCAKYFARYGEERPPGKEWPRGLRDRRNDGMNGKEWTKTELDRLRKLYPARPTQKVAELLRRSVCSVNGAAHKLRLRKTEEYLQSPEACRLRRGEPRPGVAHQFPKGHVPANKGLRSPGWSPGRMRETQFKKGQRSGKAAENWKPIGTVLTDGEGYQRIKVREAMHGEATGFGNSSVWPQLHRQVWEQHHGPCPLGHVVVFKDRDRKNCAIENLECISRGDLARRNAMWGRYPRELIEAISMNGALKRKLRSLQT